MDHHEAATADARGLRLNHAEGKLNRGGRVNRITTFFQDSDAHLRGERIGNRYDTIGKAFLFRWNAGRRSRLVRQAGSRQQHCDERKAPNSMRK